MNHFGGALSYYVESPAMARVISAQTHRVMQNGFRNGKPDEVLQNERRKTIRRDQDRGKK